MNLVNEFAREPTRTFLVENRLHKSMRANAITLMAVAGAMTMSGPNIDAQHIVGNELGRGSQEPGRFSVPGEHRKMHSAVVKARRTVGSFIAALKNPQPGQRDFEVKKPFIQGNVVEHIWLSDVRFVGNRFQGRVDDQPERIQGLKIGQLVSVNPNEISDWVYIDNGTLIGGYTIRAHYDELAPEQKREFDRTADFRFGKK